MGYCSWEGRIAKQDWSVVATRETLTSPRADDSTKSRSHHLHQDQRRTYFDES